MVSNARQGASLDYVAVVHREPCTDGTLAWVARHPDLPGCMAHGDTPEEAIANLDEARELYLRDFLEKGIDPPRPGSAWITQAILETERR